MLMGHQIFGQWVDSLHPSPRDWRNQGGSSGSQKRFIRGTARCHLDVMGWNWGACEGTASCVDILRSLSSSVHARAHKCTPSIKPPLCSVAMVTAISPFYLFIYFWFLPAHFAPCDCCTDQRRKHASLFMAFKICINVSFNNSRENN